jgi:hypothetical protein
MVHQRSGKDDVDLLRPWGECRAAGLFGQELANITETIPVQETAARSLVDRKDWAR